MSKDHSTASPECDDDVAGLFMKLGDGKGRPEYRDFSEAALPRPVLATTRPPRVTVAAAQSPEPASSAMPAAMACLPSDTPLSQLFRRLAESGSAAPDDSPLMRLRKQ